jgi:acyl-CoA reductase-like NAD-dependent aldehyde dehydrogenase
MHWKQSATAIRWNVQPFINGRYQPSKSAESIENISPADDAILCRIPVGALADVDDAVRVARQRFEDGCWSGLPPVKRAEILLKLADLIVKHKEELALLDTLEMGKPIRSSLQDVVSFGAGLLRSCAGFAEKLVGSSAPLMAGTISFNTYVPRGVVAAITPWNFPAANAVIKFAPALAVGNTVVLKPSELSPSSALRLAELAIEAGMPEGVLNVVPGLGSTVGAALASHQDVNLLSFTGSTATGRKIMELAGRSNAKPVLLECGGKSPHIVFDDVDNLDSVADAAVHAIVWNQGQVCSARTRLIVHDDVREALLEKIVARARLYRPANPLDEATNFGPLASLQQSNRVKSYIDLGRRAGAELVLDGTTSGSGNCYVAPTIFDRVEATMPIAREEIFGPVLCVLRFGTESEAIALANDTDYGLAATVWTRDIGRGRRSAHAIKAGAVAIRTSGKEDPPSGCVLGSEPQKASGFGSELGLDGLQSYSVLKSIQLVGA